MMGGGGHGGMAPTPSSSPPAGSGAHQHHGGGGMHMMHMTFYWGKNSVILFTGWPGASGGMYALALVAVFALAFLVEFLGSPRGLLLPAGPAAGKRRRVGVAAARAAVHAVRVGLAYLLMLALMSFNGGVLLVAVAGHAAGFLVFKAGLFGDRRLAQVDGGGMEHAIC